MTDSPTMSIAELQASLQAIEARIEATLWDSSLDETTALERYQQECETLESLLACCDPAARAACQALLAYALLREDDLAYEIAADLPASLERLVRAVALAEESGDALQVGRCLMVQGERLLVAERPAEATIAWERCEAIGHAGDDAKHRQLLGWLLILRTRQALRERTIELASGLAQEARALLEDIEDEAGLGALYLVLGLLYEAQERPTAEIAIARAEAGRWTARARARHKRSGA